MFSLHLKAANPYMVESIKKACRHPTPAAPDLQGTGVKCGGYVLCVMCYALRVMCYVLRVMCYLLSAVLYYYDATLLC